MKKSITYNKSKDIWKGIIVLTKNGLNIVIDLGSSKDKKIIEKRIKNYRYNG